jgi:hypothetical protein
MADEEGQVAQSESQDGASDDDLKGAVEDDVFTLGLDEITIDDDDEDPDKKKGGKKPDDAKGKDDGNKDDKGKDTPTLESLQAEINKLKGDKSNLKKALHEARQERKSKGKADDDEDTLTDTQIDAIIEQHKDDPATMRNLIRYIAKKEAKGIKKDAMGEAEMLTRKREADQLLRNRIKDFDDDESENRAAILTVKGKLGLDDHPMGDLLAAGFIAFEASPRIYQAGVEAGKKMALSEKGEKGRKEEIKDGQIPKGKGSDGKGKISKVSAETVKQMNLNPRQAKIYERLIAGKPQSVSMEE